LNILLATHNFLPYHLGGTEIYVLNMAKFLKAKSHNVTIISAISSSNTLDLECAYEDECLKVFQYQFENIKVLGVEYKVISTLQLYSKQNPAHSRSYQFFFSDKHFDILHINGFTATIGLDLLYALKRNSSKLKVISSYHTVISDPKETYTFANTLKQLPPVIDHFADILSYRFNLSYTITKKVSNLVPELYFSKLPAIFSLKYYIKQQQAAFQQLLNETDEWWVYSDGIKSIMLKTGVEENKLVFHRHGIDPIFLGKKNQATGSHKFLFNGRLLKIKGFHTLLKAWIDTDDNSDKELWITGLPTSQNKLQHYIKKTLGRKDLKWLGNLSQRQLSDIYPHVHTVIIPSECYEIGPLVFHEAIANGCNVIASDIGGCKELTEVYQNSSLSFEAGKSDDLKEKIQQSLKIKSLMSNARKVISFDLHFEKMIAQSLIYA